MNKTSISIVGKGGMGRLFGTLFASSRCTITYFGREVTAQTLAESDVIVIATPASAAPQIRTLLEQIPGIERKLVICLWSYIHSGVTAFDGLSTSVVYLHMLFGPDIEDISEQNIIVAGDYKNKLFTRFANKLKSSGGRVHYSDPVSHDKLMAYTQSMSQLSSILLGMSMARSGFTRQELHDYASLTFRLNRHTIERIMTQKAELWAELQFENAYYPAVLQLYIDDLQAMVQAIQSKDVDKFHELFNVASGFWSEQTLDVQLLPSTIKPQDAKADLATLGPIGTYSYQVAKQYAPKASLLMVNSIQDVIRAVSDGRALEGIVPVENSIQGVVAESFDGIFAHGLTITGEQILDIHHVLCALEPPQQADMIKVIYSHPQALGQCRDYLAENYPNALLVPTVSTVAGMQKIANQKDLTALAIGPKFAAKLNKLTILEEEIEDKPGNQTRFMVFSKSLSADTVLPFTMIVAQPESDRPGLLDDILSIVRKQDINMSQIESRPDRTKLGSYIFYIRLDLASDDDRYDEITQQLNAINVTVRKLTL